MDAAAVFRRSAATVNKAVLPLLDTGFGRKLMGGSFATLSYTGRRSGKAITLPVNYRRDGADIVVKVLGPDAKRWWPNFLGTGAPVEVTTGGQRRNAHAVATRAAEGGVTVRITPT